MSFSLQVRGKGKAPVGEKVEEGKEPMVAGKGGWKKRVRRRRIDVNKELKKFPTRSKKI